MDNHGTKKEAFRLKIFKFYDNCGRVQVARSMTAYGQGRQQGTEGQWEVEIHSVNRKALDMAIFLPKELLFLDVEIRKWVAQEVERGQVSVRVFFKKENEIKRNLPALKQLKEDWDSIAKEMGMSPEQEVNLRFLLEIQEQKMPQFDRDKTQIEVQKSVKEALVHFIAMREKEGVQIVLELKKSLNFIANLLQKIEPLVKKFKTDYFDKLKIKVEELVMTVPQERLLQEVAFYVQKSDVTEEVARLFCHVDQVTQMLETQNRAVGKMLDFLAQEMGREISTLNAKVADSEVSKIALLIKGEVEKIREQVQNLE